MRMCVNHKTEFNRESETSDRVERSDNTGGSYKQYVCLCSRDKEMYGNIEES